VKCSPKLWAFAGLDTFYDLFLPDSVYGKQEKEDCFFYDDESSLTAEWNRVESAANFIATHPEKQASVRDALARLTELPEMAPRHVCSADVFLVKKFLVNFERIVKSLPQTFSAEFGVGFHSHDLLQNLRLSDAQDGDESFYLTEKFSTALAQVRKSIRAIEAQQKSLRSRLLEELLFKYGIDFRFRDFVVLVAEKARALPNAEFVLEPFDSHNFVVRPVLSRELLDLAVQRDALVVRERAEENHVYEALQKSIAAEYPLLCGYIRVAARIDVALAKARLAVEYGMVRPKLSEEGSFAVVEGRFLPLANRCASDDLRYWPLTISLQKSANVVFGSNMGGKTVVLRSIAFFQLLAQLGFFVPADSFFAPIFSEIAYVGAPPSGVVVHVEEGLSGFGEEIHEFSSVWENAKKPALVLVDEFARTTNSVEASALLGAVLEMFAERRDLLGVVSTHFMELKVENTVCGFFRMKGLNQIAFAQSFVEKSKEGESLTERIHRVNRFMQYEVVQESAITPVRDALAIAEVLGLSSAIVEKAKRHMGEKYGR
jgi:dsDNA-specific endonuclease/ATPase MutS2